MKHLIVTKSSYFYLSLIVNILVISTFDYFLKSCYDELDKHFGRWSDLIENH